MLSGIRPFKPMTMKAKQGLVKLAARVAAGRIAQVEPDRVGDAVAVVVDVVGDLAGDRVGDQVGEGVRVVAVGRDRAEDPRRRVGEARAPCVGAHG